MTKQEIIHLALENLQKESKIHGVWNPVDNKDVDGLVILNIDNQKFRYNIEIKNELRNHHLEQLITLNNTYHPIMVIAARLFPKIKEELRNYNIAYLEANGNIFLKNSTRMLWIDTNRPIPVEKQTGSRAFTKTGLKVVFLFLLDENWLNRPYRQIAERTGMGIGNINNIITGLKQEGFLLPITKKEYRLNDKKELLNKWISAYELKLKPTLKIGTFRFLKTQDYTNWRNIILHVNTNKTVWGGEPAADLLTNYLHPEIFTLYTTEMRNDLIKEYRLIPDEEGYLKIYQKFWEYEGIDYETNTNYGKIAPTLLVYADLINTNDRRCIETAQKIYDEFLQNKL